MSKKIANISIAIGGMTCANCEIRIKNELRKTRGIESVSVSYARSRALITYDANEIDQRRMEQVIESLGYSVQKPVLKAGLPAQQPRTGFKSVLGVALILIALYLIFRQFGGLNIFNVFPQAEAGMGYGLLFAIGLLTSVHCVAMCGGINLSQCVPQQAARFRSGILYNAGRVISYTVIGGIVGALGSVVSFSGWARGLVALAAGVFMVIMGLNMLNIFPWLRRFNPRLPKIFAGKINAEKRGGSKSPLYIGLLNGLMPCGPLQAMQLYALSTGSPLKGALAMFLFSLGTVPLMFGLGALSAILSRKFTKKMMQVSAMLVIVLGVFMFQNGMGLSGLAAPSIATTAKPAVTQAINASPENVQLITTTLSSGRYESITVKAGIPVRWTIKAANGTINSCNNRLIIPAYKIEKKLTVGDNVIEFTPSKTGVIPYSCWMGMIRSQITVLDNSAPQ